MKKPLLFSLALATAFTTQAANSLLTSPVTTSMATARMNAMSIASNGTDVVLLLADNTSLFAVDIADNKSSEATANTISAIPDFVNIKLKPVAGGAKLTVLDIEVNPISKAVYVLAESATATYVFKVRNNGATVTLLNLTAIAHSTITWGGTFEVNAMTWGNKNLYASSGSFSLDGSVATVPSPFVHGSTVTQKATSMFKSNWGGTYVTKAPLETMAYGLVKTKHRLMGVTTCAPGFSLDASGLAGTGPITVTEDFNVQYGTSEKVVFQRHDGKDWLFDLHDNFLYRIGESLLDGTPVTAAKFNNKAVVLRSGSDPATGVVTDVFKKIAGDYSMISFWDDYRLLVLESAGTLKLMQTALALPTSMENIAVENKINVYPNPAQKVLNVTLQNAEPTDLKVFTMEGRLVYSVITNSKATTLDISGFSAGQYLLKATSTAGISGQQIFVVQ